MYLIDTNVFLEVFLDRKNAWYSLEFLKLVWSGKVEGFITDYTLHSIAVVLERRGKANLITDVLYSLKSFEGLTLIQADIDDQIEIAKLSNRTRLDFDDAYQLYFARKLGLTLISYDHHFDSYTHRLEPKDVISPLQP